MSGTRFDLACGEQTLSYELKGGPPESVRALLLDEVRFDAPRLACPDCRVDHDPVLGRGTVHPCGRPDCRCLPRHRSQMPVVEVANPPPPDPLALGSPDCGGVTCIFVHPLNPRLSWRGVSISGTRAWMPSSGEGRES